MMRLSSIGMAVFCSAACMSAVWGQTGAGSPPPSYDWDTTKPGTQGPQSPLIAGSTYRSLRTYQVSIPVLVPISELQTIIPAGFTPVATPSGSNNATITLGLFVDQRSETPDLNFGPISALLVSTTVNNTNVNPARQELLLPFFEVSGGVEALNGVFGPGSARLAKVKVKVDESDGVLSFKFTISEPRIGLHLVAEAEVPSGLTTRAVSDPVGIPFRTVNWLAPNGAFRAASQSDTATIPTASANVKVETLGNRINFAPGSVSIVGLGSTITFNRNLEFVLKFE